MAKKVGKPRSKKPTARKPRKLTATKEKSLPRVLIVDDDKNIVKSLKMAFKAKEFSAFHAYTVKSAFAAVRKKRFDVIVVDMRMPVMKGEDPAEDDAGLFLVQTLMRFGLKPKGSVLVVFTAFPNVAQCFAANDVDAFYLPKTLPGMNVSEELVDECLRRVGENRKRKSSPKRSWLGEHYDELIEKFKGKTIAVVGRKAAKENRLKGGTVVGDRVVFTAPTPKKLRERIIDNVRFWRAMPLFIDLPNS